MIAALAAAFADPPAVYRPMMFWAWNGQVTHEKIDRDLAEMKAKGCGGFFIHPMGEHFRLQDFIAGQSPPYLSDEYFALVSYAVEHAAAEGLYAWLYDEGGWPSGTAQGAVVEGHPELAGKVLTVATAADPEALAAVRLRAGHDPRLVTDPPEGAGSEDGVTVRFAVKPGGFPVDTMDPAAVRRFIEVTHERYRQCVGQHFGKTVPGIFTDEPRVGGRVGSAQIMWTGRMLEAFAADHGYDLRPYLPLLFSSEALGFDPTPYYPEGTAAAVRCAFFDAWTRLHREAYWDQLNGWCRANGLLHVGHVGGEDNLPDHIAGGFGEYFRTAGTLDVPGVDAIWRQIWMDAPKLHYPVLAASAAHQQAPAAPVGDWPRTGLALTESFGVYGFGCTFSEMKWVTDYQFVRGVNVLCPMAYSLCTEGGRLYRTMDYMGPGNPLWEHYEPFAQYVGRLSVACRAGESAADVAVYYPIEALWAQGTGDAPGSFETICGLLEDQQVQYDILGGDALLGAQIEDQLLVTPGAAYEVIIVPEMGVLRRSVAQKLAQFRAGGGRIVFLGGPPHHVVDGPRLRPTKEVVPELLAETFTVDLPKELDTLMAAFGDQPGRWMVMQLDGFSGAFYGGPWLRRFAGRRLAARTVLEVPRDTLGPFAALLGAIATRVHLGLDEPVEGVRVLTRVLDRGSVHLVVNERDEEAHLRLVISSEEPLRLEVWQPDDGKRTVLAEHTEVTDATRVEYSLGPRRSAILVATPPELAEAPADMPAERTVSRLVGRPGLPEPVSGWEIREGDVMPLRQLPTMPLDFPPPENGRWDLIPGCEHFSGTMAYRLAFDAAEDWATRPSALELSDVRYVAEAWLNGQHLGRRLWEPYTFETTGLIRVGPNELVVHVTNTLANAALAPEAMKEAKTRGWWNVYRERAQPMMEENVASGVSPVARIWLGAEMR